MSKQIKADLLLILITSFWGMSYYLTDLCLVDLPPLCLTAFRFLTAFVLLGSIFIRNLRHLNRITLRCSCTVGLALTGTYIFYGYGISRTSLSNAAFICSLAVVFTPLLGYFFFRSHLTRRQILCTVICVCGLALLTLNDDLIPASGDLICFGVPICYSLDLLLTEKSVQTPGVDALNLGICELGIVGIITLTASLLMEQPHLPTTPKTWFCALFLGLFCSGIAFVVQTVQQKNTVASHVGLIFTLEPVFATIVAYVFAGERIRPRGQFGMALMMLSLVLMEVRVPLNLSFLRKIR